MLHISIEAFDGPLDLMLFLIKEKKLDLFDLDVSELITQYQLFLESMKQQKFEVASEYLSELAGLLEYKSKKLLPTVTATLEAEDVVETADSLVARLLAYQQVKELTAQLETRYLERMQYLSKSPIKSDVFDVKTTIINQKDDLLKAMLKVMQRVKLEQPFQVKTATKELSVEERIEQIEALISKWDDRFSLDQLFAQKPNIETVVVTFLAVLDMIRANRLTFTIVDDTVWISRRTNHEPA